MGKFLSTRPGQLTVAVVLLVIFVVLGIVSLTPEQQQSLVDAVLRLFPQ